MGMYWEFPKLLDEGYDKKIRPSNNDKRLLMGAREAMREALRVAFVEEKAQKSQNTLLLETARYRLGDDAGFSSPKFRIQGSFAYSTDITAIQHPPQEVDMDDGMFLPVTYFEGDGGGPMVASDAYFKKVEVVLGELARKRRWKLVTSKSTCVRMQINERLHVDLPLYAIRDSEFTILLEKAISTASFLTRDSIEREIELRDAFYRGIAANNIMLAHRDDGWITSDPRKLEDFFKNAVAVHGDKIQKVSRILKAQRDANSERSPLSSLAIMVGVVDTFENNPSLNQYKLCDIVGKVCGHLDTFFASTVFNPAFPDRQDLALCAGWKLPERNEIRRSMRDLQKTIENAGRSSDKGFAMHLLAGTFGTFMENDADLIHATNATAQSFANTAAEQQPEPPVQSYTSG